MDIRRTLLPGSHRKALSGTAPAGPLDVNELVTLTLLLRRRAPLPQSLAEGPDWITSVELAARYGADPADAEVVAASLSRLGLTVSAVDLASRRLMVTGPVGVAAHVFGASLAVVRPSGDPTGDTTGETTGETTDAPVRTRVGDLSVPAELDGIVHAVLGLDQRPQASAKFRFAPAAAHGRHSYTPPQLGTVYNFPAGTTGAGQTIAIIELGGGYGQSDLDAYFSGLGIPTPSVVSVGVDGGANVPGKDPGGADGEVLLDIEVVGALAPQAKILVYFAPNTDQGFLDALATAAHASPAPAAISISWGQSEDAWTAQAVQSFDQALADAAALGVTVCVAAGDGGSADGQSDGNPHADFPASSPHALACGGTSLTADPATGKVMSEKVWNSGASGGATGGGVSDVFALPAWQAHAGVPTRGGKPGRGVPDVAGDADPATGYKVLVDGSPQVIGGTSAVAPLWAALVSRLTEALGHPLGLLQPTIYGTTPAGTPAAGFRDITSGTNGAYHAGPGWDACTGLGVPDGTALLAVLKSARP